MKVCEHCGYNPAPEALYCIMCGAKLTGHGRGRASLLGGLRRRLHRDYADDELGI